MTREQRLRNLEKELLSFRAGDRVRITHSGCVSRTCFNCTLEGVVLRSHDVGSTLVYVPKAPAYRRSIAGHSRCEIPAGCLEHLELAADD
jgi:hypothetical protein